MKPRLTRGMLMIAAGLLTIIVATVYGIMQASSDLYLDLQSFEIDLATGGEIPYQQDRKQKISFWLKQADREIEGKEFALTIKVLDQSRTLLEGFRRDMRYVTPRHDLPAGHYYKLGSYRFGEGFKGFLQYEADGSWLPAPADAGLLLRTSKQTSFSRYQLVWIVGGALLVVFGIGALMRDTAST